MYDMDYLSSFGVDYKGRSILAGWERFYSVVEILAELFDLHHPFNQVMEMAAFLDSMTLVLMVFAKAILIFLTFIPSHRV